METAQPDQDRNLNQHALRQTAGPAAKATIHRSKQMKYNCQYIKKDNAMYPKFRRFLTVVMVIALFITLPLSAALCDRIEGDRDGDGQGRTAELTRAYVTISVKSKGYLQTNIGERWAINTHPLIIGTDGKQVKLRDMPVPCEVEMLYYERDNRREVYRIDIKMVYNGAHQRFMGIRTE
jgi:hypothetical protein